MELEKRHLSKTTKASEPRKKPYAHPRLTNYGDAREITRALDIGGTDGQGGSQELDTQP